MARERTRCPDCGYKFTIEIATQRARRIGVRSKRVTGNQFDYTITVPERMIETGKFITTSDDIILAGCFSAFMGILAGGIAQALLPSHLPDKIIIEATVQTIVIWSGIGGVISYGWLCAEYNQRLKKILPMFLEQKEKWSAAKDDAISGNVNLTVDQRYRDGHSEAGRTVMRFGTLPVDVKRFNEWVQGVLAGKSLAVNKWVPRAVLFTQPEYVRLLNHLTAGEIIVNAGSSKGNVLTVAGRRALAGHLADFGIRPPSPASETDFLGERLAQAQANNGGNTPLPRSEVCVGGENG